MSNYFNVSTRWADIVTGKTTKAPLRNPRMPINGDMIYSYGPHFEMARPIRDRKGVTFMFLVNGDTFSPSTANHQSDVRAAIARTGLPSVIIPYRALNAAGINRDSVRVLEVTPDHNEVTEYVHTELPQGAILEWVPFSDYVELNPAQLQTRVDKINAKAQEEWATRQQWVRDELNGKEGHIANYWTKRYWLIKAPKPISVETWLANLSEYSLYHETRGYQVIGHRLTCYTDARRKHEWDISYLTNGTTQYRRTTTRHWLGESLIEGQVDYQVTRRCKSCRATGRAEGPIPARWVAPEPITEHVRFSERPRYRVVDTLRVEPGYWKELTHKQPICSACRGQGSWRETRRRKAKFLSGFDANETRPSYFFCELPPKSTATTVASAYEALKPDSVRLAEQMGREVRRQGDIYAVPMAAVTRRDLTKAGATFTKRGNILNTNHEATGVAYLPDGTTLVRGCLHHAPANREPDHRRISLGRQWHVVQKNLVPTAA